MTTTIEKLTGQELLDFVNNNPTMTKTDLCSGAGYAPMIDGVLKYKFTDFYEAILDAKNANGEYKVVTTGEYYEMNGRDWYEDVLDDQGRALYDAIEDRCPEFSKLDAEQCQEFMDELSEQGINTADDFESAYVWQTDAYNVESKFSEYVATEINCVDIPDYIFNHIDWQSMWDYEMRHDFFTIEFDGETYFFSNIF